MKQTELKAYFSKEQLDDIEFRNRSRAVILAGEDWAEEATNRNPHPPYTDEWKWYEDEFRRLEDMFGP